MAKDLEKKPMSYIPAHFIYSALPLNINKKETAYKKEYGKSVKVILSMLGSEGIPAGRYARLLLTLFTTEAVVRKSEKKIVLRYKSKAEILKKLDLPRQRGGSIEEQLERFASCMLSIIVKDKRTVTEQVIGDSPKWVKEEIEQSFELKLKAYNNIRFFSKLIKIEMKQKRQEVAYEIHLSEEFIEMAQHNSVPLDYSVYKNIQAPLGNDLYIWFMYKNEGKLPPEGKFITKRQLVEQFSMYDKKTVEQRYDWIIDEIINIKTNYCPSLKVEIDPYRKGITIKKSKSVILEKDKRYIPMVYGE